QTRIALNSALRLTQDLNAAFRIVLTRVVPYPLPLDRPPVPAGFTERQVAELTNGLEVDTAVCIYNCRDRETAVLQSLPPRSVVVVGSRRCWWPSPEKRLLRALRRAGHSVIFMGAS